MRAELVAVLASQFSRRGGLREPDVISSPSSAAHRFRSRRLWASVGTASFLSFIALSIAIVTGAVYPFDDFASRVVIDAVSPRFLDDLRILNQIGHRLTLVAAAVIALALYRVVEGRILAAVAFLVGAPIVGSGIALLISRPRPEGEGLSFPSGHVFGSLVVYGLIAVVVSQQLRLPYWRRIVLCVTVALVLSVGIARVGLRAHWPSDVVGAALLGCAYLSLGVRTLRAQASASSTESQEPRITENC